MTVQIQLANLRKALTPPPGANAADYVLNFMVTGTEASGKPINLNAGLPESLAIGQSVPIDDYISGPNKGLVTFDYIDGGRLYIGYGTLPYDTYVGAEYGLSGKASYTDQPVPYWKRYYGLLEFAYVPGDTGLWIDLSNVNLAALPIGLAGYSVFGESFQMGYKGSMDDIRTKLGAVIGTSGGCPGATSDSGIATKITCVTGLEKIVSPTAGNAACWRSFSDYVTTLASSSTRISITSDTPAGGSPVTFTGGFENATSAEEDVIVLSGGGHTLKIQLGQFTTPHIYACANGTIEFDGTTFPFDIKTGTAGISAADVTISNSTVRNILIGMNEGRFVPSSSSSLNAANDSQNWGGAGTKYGPFPQASYGNQYAEIIFQNANAYGYPYADRFLKALAIANIAEPIQVTACADDASCNYSAKPPIFQSPDNFQIGAGSSALGAITIGSNGKSAPILPGPQGSYDGSLLAASEYTRMNFAGAGDGKYILYKYSTNPAEAVAMKDAQGNECLLVNGAPYNGKIFWEEGVGGKGHSLVFPGNVSWNPKAGPAVSPT